MKYRMIGIDIDGTLLDRRGKVSEANRNAIAAAADQGVVIVPCTGRSWHESHAVIDDVQGMDTGVFVTGAAINEVASGALLDHSPLSIEIATQLVEMLSDLPDAVLVFREFTRTGHHYLITGRGELTMNTQWWFKRTGAVVHHQPEVSEDDLQHALRVAVVATGKRMGTAQDDVRLAFDDRVTVHSFEAIQRPDDFDDVHILEVFAAGVDKWSGLRWVAQQHGIADDEIAVIGDEINDVSMLESAGCGIAMDNAMQCARDAAKYVTKDRDESGVAFAIDQLVQGAWG